MAEQPADPTQASDEDIEKLLKEAESSTSMPAPGADATQAIESALAGLETQAAATTTQDAIAAVNADQAAIDEILRQASFEDPTTAGAAEQGGTTAAGGIPSNQYLTDDGEADAATAAAAQARDFPLPNFSQVIQDAQVSSIDLLRDVELNVKIELGRSKMLVEDVLKLGEGSVVELDKLAGDPVDVFVNERLVARGEVLVLNDNFCVRINEIVQVVKEEGV